MPRTFRIITLAALLLAGCGKGSPPATAPAATVHVRELGPGPRIVSTVPAATLNLVLIGGDDRLVGVSPYDQLFLPEGEKDLPVVGDQLTMNYELLAKLKPNVIIIQTAASRIEPKLKQLAAEQHAELLNIKLDHVEDIWKSVQSLGKACGREEQANAAIDKAQWELRESAKKYENKPHPKVVYLISPSSVMVCGGKTFIDEMITAAGGENVGATIGEGFIDTSRETLIKLAPDVLLINAMEQPERIENDPRIVPWFSLPVPAAASKRVFLVTDGNSLTASVDIGKNVRALAELIHKGESGDGAGGGKVGEGP